MRCFVITSSLILPPRPLSSQSCPVCSFFIFTRRMAVPRTYVFSFFLSLFFLPFPRLRLRFDSAYLLAPHIPSFRMCRRTPMWIPTPFPREGLLSALLPRSLFHQDGPLLTGLATPQNELVPEFTPLSLNRLPAGLVFTAPPRHFPTSYLFA